MLFLIFWWVYFQPKPANKIVQTIPAAKTEQQIDIKNLKATTAVSKDVLLQNIRIPEKEIVVETDSSRIVLTNHGAAVKNWFIKEKSGNIVDLVDDKDSGALSTFPGSNYEVTQNGPRNVTFTHTSFEGWKITKTYDFSANYLHNLKIEIVKTKRTAELPYVSVGWGPGIGTDLKEKSENSRLVRALGYDNSKPAKLEKFKPGDYSVSDYKWVGIDNRYFLAAFVLGSGGNFDKVEVFRQDKSHPIAITLSSAPKPEVQKKEFLLTLYAGPKEYEKLKALKLNLDEAVDFGMFGFLGKAVLYSLNFINRITGNFGWSIIILTLIMQLIVAPLTIKSFKASAAMKQLQPHIKELQEKYKSDAKRLNAEILNLYRTQKVNPLGGCLPMILQLPIFWALFTTLRNAYDLRGAHWLLWIKDLSAPDSVAQIGSISVNILPLIMGIGMFFQQKMMSVSTDKTQAQMMYMMPVVFTFMFWGFPSGLVLYWLTNSVLTMLEQYFILKGASQELAKA